MLSLCGAMDGVTANVMVLRFGRMECLSGYFRTPEETILRFGISSLPIYRCHSAFSHPSLRGFPPGKNYEGQRGGGRIQFGKILDILSLSPIKAVSPQA
jgi:hypothetical protein